MINLQIIKNECKKHERCERSCPFYDYDYHNGCLFCYDPCDWDMPAITKAVENMSSEVFNQIHDALIKKIVDVMPHDRKDVIYNDDRK